MADPITQLPPAPSRQDPINFSDEADALLGALDQFVTETNAVAVAMNLNDTNDVSSSSVAIGLGAKTFTVTAAKSFLPGMFLAIADAAAASTNSMFGQITSYSGTTLIMNMTGIIGSGTKSSWVISQSVPVGTIIGPLSATTGNFTDNVTVSDGKWIGLGAGKGRFQLDDEAKDVVTLQDAMLRKPKQPSFQVTSAAAQDNLAVGATPVKIVFDTETIDQGSDFTSSSFTSPLSGNYLFTANVTLNNVDSAATLLELYLQTSTAFLLLDSVNPNNVLIADGLFNLNGSKIISLAVGFEAFIAVKVTGGASQADVVINTAEESPSFSGVLIS
ncbi:hypothetical protein KAR91_26150 [Candidatus Pacearchaeota archaeon]|nr:hypothetical protein [Candidatus Pacearchaeota archaeon]